MLPDILKEVQQVLRTNIIVHCKDHNDERVNSSLTEERVIKLLKSNFDIIIPCVRYWYDVIIIDGDKKLYCNIKCTVSSKRTADNVGSIKGLSYAVTGNIPNKSNDIRKIYSYMMNNCADTDVDYYFIIADKKNSKLSFVTSLKLLNEVTMNYHNLPFQCVWHNNRILVEKSYKEFINQVMLPVLTAHKKSKDNHQFIIDVIEKNTNLDYDNKLVSVV